MDLALKDDVAVVVGGARGIGQAIARLFAEEGARTAILDIDPRVEEAARQLPGGAERCVGVACDIGDGASVAAARDTVLRRCGRIDHVVHAAAIGSGKFGFPFLNLEPADWEATLRVNVLGTVQVAHAFAPTLVSQRRGTILLLASVAGQIGSQTDPPYSASKAAVINFAQCMAKDLAPHGVRVNALCPGMVQTELNRSVWAAWHAQEPPEKRRSYEDWAGDKVKSIVPLGRWQEPRDIAHMAVFLASECARNVTGQTINVDGGYVMHW
jgi:NAD(P)-dependent dehydrogenase (short-subunit alcohol dehydrogenase family)